MSSVDPQAAATVPGAPPVQAGALSVAETEAQALLARLDRETKALGAVPAAARLFHEMGQVWEQALHNPRNAAISYQNAFRLDPTNLPNIRSARRLFAEVGNWQMALQLLDAELAATPEPVAKAALRMERGLILEERLNRAADALTTFEQALVDAPHDLALLCHLEASYAARSDHAKLLPILLTQAEVSGDERLRAHYLLAASTLCEEKLNLPGQAEQLLEQAFALRPRDPVLLTERIRRAERTGSGEAIVRALASEAEALGQKAGPVYYQIGRLLEHLGRGPDAISALQAARQLTPTDPLLISELARLFEQQGRWEELADVLAARAVSVADPQEKVTLLLRLAALHEERLKRDDQALAYLQSVLAVQPGHAAALSSLGKLHHRRGDWAGLLATYELEAASLEDIKLRATPLYKAAEVLEQKLGREDEAMLRHAELLRLMPGYLPAQKALGRLYEKHQRYAELVAMHEADLAQTKDRDQVVSTLHQIATIQEDHLHDLEAAAHALHRALEAAPEHLPTIRALARVYELAGKWNELVGMNDRERAGTNDTKQVVSLLHRNAELYDEKLNQPELAVDAYKKVLTLSPTYLPALKALGRIYGAKQRWDDLIQMYRQEADIAPSIDQAASLTFKVGEIYEDKLKDVNQAVTAYEEVLTLAPAHLAALRSLERIHRTAGSWESLVHVLHSEAAIRADPGERANTLFQIAAIWEGLGKLDLAMDAYAEVLALAPGHATALRSLERIYSHQDNKTKLVELYERQTQSAPTPEERASGYARLARLYTTKLEDPVRAAACLEAILLIQPDHPDALKTLERLKAADRAARIELRAQLATQVTSKQLAAQLWASAAQDLERQGSHERALKLWRQAHSTAPSPRTSAGLEAALTRSGDLRGMASLLTEQLEHESQDGVRFSLAMRLGRLCELLGDGARALNAYGAALKFDARSIPALQVTRRLFLAQGDFKLARATLTAEAQVTADKAEAVLAWTDAGQLAQDKLADAQGAAADYQKALDLDPNASVAAVRLEELLAKQGGGVALATLNLKKGEAKLAGAKPDEAAAAFYEAARILVTELNQIPAGQAAAERAVAAQPTHVGALTLLADLHQKGGRFAEAARFLAARLEQGGTRPELAGVHLRLGVLYQDQLRDNDRAAAHLQTALADAPNNVEAMERLSRLHLGSRNWSAAADVLKRIIEASANDPARLTAHTLTLARVFDDGFGEPVKAAALYKRVLELAPSEPGVFDRLAALYDRLGQTAELAPLLEAQAAKARTPQEILGFRFKAAQLYTKLNEPTRAVASLRFALEADGGSIEARAMLADLLAKEPSQATAAIEEYRQLLRLDPFRPDAYHALYRLYDQTRQVDRQLCVASLLMFLKQANDFERLFSTDAKVPQDTTQPLTDADIETLLQHPAGRTPLADVLRLIGDQLYKLYPGDLDSLGLGRSDKIKPDSALAKALKAVCLSLGVERYELYQGKRGAAVVLENTDPQSVIIGVDFVRKYQMRDQKFQFARAAITLRNKTLLAQRLNPSELANLMGAAIRAVAPDFARLGVNDAELTKKVRKALPNKVLKELETLRGDLDRARLDVPPLVQALHFTADRAGLLYSGDISGALVQLVHEDAAQANAKLDTFEAVRAAAFSRPDVRELMSFAISDDYFRLRSKLKLGLG